VFQAGGLVVVLVEVTRKSYLASIVPVIVNAILNEHQVIADIIAFISKGDFPRSRLGEKQRGKILGSWVTKRMRTIAQFSIRDSDGPAGHIVDAQVAETSQRMNRGSKTGSVVGNSFRRSTVVPDSDSPGISRSSPATVHDTHNNNEPVIESHQASYGDPKDEEPEEPFYEEVLQSSDYGFPEIIPGSETKNEAFHDVEFRKPSLSVTNPSEEADSPSTIVNPNRTFSFTGEFSIDQYDDYNQYTSMDPSSAIPPFQATPSPAAASRVSPGEEVASPIPSQSKGRGSLPSQQLRYSSLPAGASSLRFSTDLTSERVSQRQSSREKTSSSSAFETNIQDWPQEALLYQSTPNSDDFAEENTPGQLNRFPRGGSIMRSRYDGSDYGAY
jgi:hypothetical protein